MTTVYFVRHAEPNRTVGEDATYPLTEKGLADCALVTEFLRDKGVDVVLSSPFKRAVDTVKNFAETAGLPIDIIDDFRERKVSSKKWIDDFISFAHKQWDDISYKLEGGESIAETQERNIRALESVLTLYRGKTIAIGTHGTALSSMIRYYDVTYGVSDWLAMPMPYVIKMEFSETGCVGMEKIDLFNPNQPPNYENCLVRTASLGELKAYKYTVIFAQYHGKWLYCRHKNRDVYETAGGHIETSETIQEAAKRELFEETGAIKFDIEPVFDYAVHLPTRYANGQVFLAKIHELGKMPNFEMTETRLFDTIPDKMRFPQILPILFEKIQLLARFA
ncbi:MAG: histidine phosphatase family protein [Defluviitaleaceae bacterium]|nr:histidine phosphatase family protein [Defluviitaleaceae bacterium]